jgi:hypothetical protein
MAQDDAEINTFTAMSVAFVAPMYRSRPDSRQGPRYACPSGDKTVHRHTRERP